MTNGLEVRTGSSSERNSTVPTAVLQGQGRDQRGGLGLDSVGDT